MGGARNPGDGSAARRVRSGARRGPSLRCLVGGLTSTTVHFPRALGTPAASCQPPLFTFARSFHLHLLPHYLLLIVSGERLSFCLPVRLAFFFSFLFLLPSHFSLRTSYLSPLFSFLVPARRNGQVLQERSSRSACVSLLRIREIRDQGRSGTHGIRRLSSVRTLAVRADRSRPTGPMGRRRVASVALAFGYERYFRSAFTAGAGYRAPAGGIPFGNRRKRKEAGSRCA